MEYDISVVLLNYNTRDMLDSCIQSLRDNHSGLSLELIVVDNASSDGSVQMIKGKHPDVLLVENDSNLGSARGTNMGVRLASAPYILVLNPDTLIKPVALRSMLEYMDSHEDVGLVGPRLVGEDGRYQQSCHYFTILKARYALLLFLTLIGSRGLKGLGLSTNPSGDGRDQAVVDWVYTACALVRREVFERVGLLDENLFFGGDDMELCYRAGQAGWKTVYLPQAVVVHYGNQSAVQVFGEAHSYARARARVIGIDYFLRKYFSALHSYVIRGILGVGSLIIAMMLRVASLLKRGDEEIAVRAAHSERMGLACLASMFWRGGKEYSWVQGG